MPSGFNVGRRIEGAMFSNHDHERVERWRKTTDTWIRKTAASIGGHAEGNWGLPKANEAGRWLLGYEAGQLSKTAIEASANLTQYVLAEDVDELLEAASELRRRLRARALAEKLAGTDGRTPAETAEFERKAKELGDG